MGEPLVAQNNTDPESVALIWQGDHTRCGRFFITEQLKPVEEFPFRLFGRPGHGQESVECESENPGGGYKTREAAQKWAGCVAYQLEFGAERAT